MASPEDIAATAESLRRIVAAVDGGEVEADEAERAYLVGAADALEALAGEPTRPDLR